MSFLNKMIAPLWGALLLISTKVWAEGSHGGGAAIKIEDSADGQHAEIVSGDVAAGGHAEAVGLPQFDPSSFASQVFWLAIIFAVLYIFFSKKTLPEISSVIEDRQVHIQDDLDMANQLKQEAETVHQTYEDLMDQARHKSGNLFHKAEAAVKGKTDLAGVEFQKRAAKDLEKTQKTIEAAKLKALGDVDLIVAQIASEAAEKIIGVKADLKSAENVVQSLQDKRAKAA